MNWAALLLQVVIVVTYASPVLAILTAAGLAFMAWRQKARKAKRAP